MTVLSNFPMVSQLTPISTDGSSPNAQFDCVPACLCAGVMYLKGVHTVNAEYNPDLFLDKVYGEGHRGGTDAKEYINFIASFGIHLHSIEGNSEQLIAEAHQALASNSSTILTILDPYVPASYGWTHAVIAFADSMGELTVLDPYIGRAVTKSNSEWSTLLRGSVLWVLTEIEVPVPAVSPVPVGWRDDGTTLTAPNGVHVVLGFRQWVLSHSWEKDNYPITVECPLNPLEYSNVALGSGSQQLFRWKVLEYTKERGVFEAYCGPELLYLRGKAEELYKAYRVFVEAYQVGQAIPGTIADAQAKQ